MGEDTEEILVTADVQTQLMMHMLQWKKEHFYLVLSQNLRWKQKHRPCWGMEQLGSPPENKEVVQKKRYNTRSGLLDPFSVFTKRKNT